MGPRFGIVVKRTQAHTHMLSQFLHKNNKQVPICVPKKAQSFSALFASSAQTRMERQIGTKREPNWNQIGWIRRKFIRT